MSEKQINIQVGHKLRSRRIAMGLSQSQLAKSIGIASQQVQKYEKGMNSMNAERLHEFSRFMKVPVSYFFENVENKKSSKKQKNKYSFAEDTTGYESEANNASDRETIEVLKSFKRIKDHAVRKRIADLLRAVSLKDI